MGVEIRLYHLSGMSLVNTMIGVANLLIYGEVIDSELVEGFNALWKFQLLNVADYKPYCSDGLCLKKGKFSVEHMQFKCACGRIENDDPEFLKTYGKVWAMPWALEKDN